MTPYLAKSKLATRVTVGWRLYMIIPTPGDGLIEPLDNIRHAADLIFLVVILLGWWVIFTISNRNSYQTTSLKSPCFMVNSPNFGWKSCTIKSSHVGIMFLIHLKNPSKFTLKSTMKSTLGRNRCPESWQSWWLFEAGERAKVGRAIVLWERTT